MKARAPILATSTAAVACAVAVAVWAERHHLPAVAPSSASQAPPSIEAAAPAPPPLPADFLPSFLAAIRSRSGLAGPLPEISAAELAAQLASFGPSQLCEVAAALRSAPDLDRDLRTSHLGWILQLLERREPSAALALFEELEPSLNEEDRRTIAAGMLPPAAADEPEQTAAWWLLHAADFGRSAARLQEEILAWAAARQPEQAFSLIDKLHITDLYTAGSGIGRAATSTPSWTGALLALRAYLKRLPDAGSAEALRRGVMAGISASLLYHPREEAFSWTEMLDPSEQRALAEGLDPGDPPPPSGAPAEDQSAAAWLAWIPDRIAPEHLPAKVEALVACWTRRFPDAAEQWIVAVTEPAVKEAAARGYVAQAAGDRPGNASRIAGLLPDGPSRRALFRNIEDARSLRYGFMEERPGE